MQTGLADRRKDRDEKGGGEMVAYNRYIEHDIQQKCEFYDYGHAIEILHEGCVKGYE
jgi:hypothetical protein